MEEELDLEGTVVGEIGAVRGVSLLIDTEQRSERLRAERLGDFGISWPDNIAQFIDNLG